MAATHDGPQPRTSSRRATLAALAAIAFVPLAFLVATRGNWMVDFGGEDGWIYIKYFMIWGHPHPDLRQFMDTNYKASRIPWIVPGYLLYRAIGPLAATYVLHLTVLVGSAICLWLALRRLFGEAVAVVTTLLLLAYPGFQSSGITHFWNYHGQIALAYYLVAAMAVVLGTPSRYALLWYGAAGAALMAAVSTSLTHVVLLPSFGVLVLAVQRRLTVRGLLSILAAGAAGAALAFLVFALTNFVAGGPFLYFWSQVVETQGFSDTYGKPPPFATWFPQWFKSARWVGFPPMVAVMSLVVLVPLARWQALGDRRWLVVGCLLQHLACWAVLIATERDVRLIEVAYQYRILLGPAAFALAALLWATLRLDRPALPAAAIAVLAVGLVLPQIALDEPIRDSLRAALDLGQWLPLPSSGWWAYFLAASVGIGLLLAGLRQRRLPLMTAGSLVLGVSCALTALSASAFVPPGRCDYLGSQYRIVLYAVEWSASHRLDTRTLIWFDPAAEIRRGADCPPIRMFPIFDAIQHGTIIQLAVNPVPPRLADARTEQLNTAIRNRWTMVLLSTVEGAADTEAQFQAWLARASVRGLAERGARFEAEDGDVSVVMQAFQLRRP